MSTESLRILGLETNKSITQSIQELIGTNGIFHISWRKKDRRLFVKNQYGFEEENIDFGKHTILRTGNFRLGVVKNLKGGERNTSPEDYMIAFDMGKKGYRNIYYNTIEKITVNKQTFTIKVIDNKKYRFAMVEPNKYGAL